MSLLASKQAIAVTLVPTLLLIPRNAPLSMLRGGTFPRYCGDRNLRAETSPPFRSDRVQLLNCVYSYYLFVPEYCTIEKSSFISLAIN